MFHWICPECGREIPPAVKECAACDPKASVAAAPEPLAPPNPPAVLPPPIPLPGVEPELPLDFLLPLAEAIRAAQAPDQPSKPELPADPATAAPAPVEILAAPAEPEVAPEAPPADVADDGVKVARAEPSKEAAAAEPEAVPAPLPDVDDGHEVNAVEAAEPANAAAVPDDVAVSATVEERPRDSLLLAAARSALALLPAPATLPQEEIKTEEIPLSLVPAPPAIDPVASASPEPPAPERAAAVSVESIKPPPNAPAEHKPASPLAFDLVASAAELPVTSSAPAGPLPQLAGLQDYRAAAGRAMRAAVPDAKVFTPDSGPRITLPGPALPPQLNSLQQANVTMLPHREPESARRLPGWAVSLLFVIGIPAFGAALLFYFMPLGRSNAETKPVAQDSPSTVVQASSHPLAQYIEVTGFRFIVDLNKQSEIHYLVVNHSAAEMADMTVYVTLRTADAKAGQPPVCRFSFRAPTLAPFESKEMTSPIEKLNRPVALPEWQDIRSDVQIAQ